MAIENLNRVMPASGISAALVLLVRSTITPGIWGFNAVLSAKAGEGALGDAQRGAGGCILFVEPCGAF